MKGLGIKLMRGQTNLAVNDDVRIVFSLGDQSRGVIKDICLVVFYSLLLKSRNGRHG